MPLRSHGSLSMNRALMAAGLVDRVQVTIFPVITGQTGADPIFQGAADFDLELLESRTLDGTPRAHLPAHPACLTPQQGFATARSLATTADPARSHVAQRGTALAAPSLLTLAEVERGRGAARRSSARSVARGSSASPPGCRDLSPASLLEARHGCRDPGGVRDSGNELEVRKALSGIPMMVMHMNTRR